MTDGELRATAGHAAARRARDDGDVGGVGGRAAGAPIPRSFARLVAEIDAQASDRRSASGGEEYMTAVVNETLRVRPWCRSWPACCRRTCQVGDYALPRGTRRDAIHLFDES